MPNVLRITPLALLVSFAACQMPLPVGSESSALIGGTKFASHWTLVGSLAMNSSSAPTAYHSSPTYRAFSFTGAAGQKVQIGVRAATNDFGAPTGGDAIAWLLDGTYHELAVNDDASDSTTDAQITSTLAAAGTYYIVFRDLDLASATFVVSLDLTGCNSDTDCGGGRYCSNTGICVLQKSTGSVCALKGSANADCFANGNCAECASGNCADGYCCNTSCAGDCQTCAATPGTCTITPAGAPRDGHTCGGTGTCRGTCNGSSPACVFPSGTCEGTNGCAGSCANGSCNTSAQRCGASCCQCGCTTLGGVERCALCQASTVETP